MCVESYCRVKSCCTKSGPAEFVDSRVGRCRRGRRAGIQTHWCSQRFSHSVLQTYPEVRLLFLCSLILAEQRCLLAFNDNEQKRQLLRCYGSFHQKKKTCSRSKLYPPGKGQSAYSMYEVHARKAYPYVMVFRSQTSTRRTLTSRYDMCRICIVHIQPRKHC